MQDLSLSKYWYIVVDLGLISLSDAFSNPNDIAIFLFLQFNKCIEDAKVKLALECEHVQFDLVLEELILEGLLAGVISSTHE